MYASWEEAVAAETAARDAEREKARRGARETGRAFTRTERLLLPVAVLGWLVFYGAPAVLVGAAVIYVLMHASPVFWVVATALGLLCYGIWTDER